MRWHHYSIHTERSYLDWIKRYALFHRMRSPEDLAGAECPINDEAKAGCFVICVLLPSEQVSHGHAQRLPGRRRGTRC
jgi:hypothetical protein